MSAAEMLAGAALSRVPDWHSLAGKKVACTVRRLRVRIVKAVRLAAERMAAQAPAISGGGKR